MIRYMTDDDRVFDDETDAINYQRVLAEQKINDIKDDLFDIFDSTTIEANDLLILDIAEYIVNNY